MEVRLEAQAGVRVRLLQPLVEGDRALGVAAALHVDPQRPAVLAGLLREPARVRERPLHVEVVAELRELDADFAVEATGLDVVHEAEVMLDDGITLLDAS